MPRIKFRITDELFERIKNVSKKRHSTQSDLIRIAIENHLNQSSESELNRTQLNEYLEQSIIATRHFTNILFKYATQVESDILASHERACEKQWELLNTPPELKINSEKQSKASGFHRFTFSELLHKCLEKVGLSKTETKNRTNFEKEVYLAQAIIQSCHYIKQLYAYTTQSKEDEIAAQNKHCEEICQWLLGKG